MKFKELLDNQEYTYEDEKINSNIYLISLKKSLRQMKGLVGTKDYEKYLKENEWMREDCAECESIGVISFDKVKEMINADLPSCDGFFYNGSANPEKVSVLLEFKDVNKSKLLDYIKSDGNDSIYAKLRCSAEILKNNIEFEGGFTGEELIKHTHVIIVYGDKADTVSNVQLGFGKKQVIQKNKNGRQSKAIITKHEITRKEDKQILNNFKKKVKKLEFASCEKGYFGIPISEPDADKQNGAKKTYSYTLFTKKNFQDVIAKENFFDGWNWGVYQEYFEPAIEESK